MGGAAKRQRIVVAAAMFLAILAISVLCWGCAPTASSEQPSSGGGTPQEAVPAADAGGYPDFLEASAGIFPDTYLNSEVLHTGSRGCNSCHSDLFDVMNLREGNKHILVHSGFDKNLTYKDCEPCHRAHGKLTGPYLGDLIHVSHYGNEQFVAANGNCWSCHAINSEGKVREYEFELWDDFNDSVAVGGFPLGGDAPVRDWVKSRGFKNGFITQFSTDANPQIDVTFNQNPTDHDDVFIVDNWGAELTSKGEGDNIFKIEGEGDTFDYDSISLPDNAVTITGVKNPKTFTKADLEAMPQTEFTMGMSCATNGHGASLTANIPMTGVSLDYVLEQCGGVLDGMNAVDVTGWDGWKGAGSPVDISVYDHDAYLVTKYYGEDLTPADGAPIVLASRGSFGSTQVKHVKSIDFIQSETPFVISNLAKSHQSINGAWFQNNGNTYKVGEPIELTGAVYSWTKVVGPLDTISFSFDMGETWVDYDVDAEIADFDPAQWVQFSLKWTPTQAGTYQVKLNASDGQGNAFHTFNTKGEPYEKPVTLFLTVEE